MKKSAWIIFIAVAVLAGILCVSVIISEEDALLKTDFTIENGTSTQVINPFKGKDGYYLFLPSYAQNENVKISSSGDISVDDERITVMYSANVPAVSLELIGGTLAEINESKDNSTKAVFTMTGADGTVTTGGVKSFHGRGNETWGFDKKPYTIKFDEKIDLLGSGSAESWVLLANATDSSNLRNKIAYDGAKLFGIENSIDSTWVDLYINGEYLGLYLLCEKVEVAENRIELSENVTSFFGEVLNNARHKNDYNNSLTIDGHYYGFDFLGGNSDESLAFARESLSTLQTALENQEELSEIADTDSFVKYYLLQEIFANTDDWSQYFYREEGGLIKTGPIWDFDKSLGQGIYDSETNPDALYTFAFNYFGKNLYANKNIRTKICELYQTEGINLINKLCALIPMYEEYIESASQMNAIRWSSGTGYEYSGNTDIVEFLETRRDSLSGILRDGVTAYSVKTEILMPYKEYGYFTVKDGETIDFLGTPDRNQYDFIGWFDEEGNKVSNGDTISENVTLIATYNINGQEWSNPAVRFGPVWFEEKFEEYGELLICTGIILSALIIVIIVNIKSQRKRKNGK